MFCCGSSHTHMSYQAVWKQPVRSFIFRRISVKLSQVTFFNQSILLYKSDTTKSLLHSGLVTCSCQTRGEAVPLLEMSIYNALQSFKCWTFLFRKDLSCVFCFFFQIVYCVLENCEKCRFLVSIEQDYYVLSIRQKSKGRQVNILLLLKYVSSYWMDCYLV